MSSNLRHVQEGQREGEVKILGMHAQEDKRESSVAPGVVKGQGGDGHWPA